MVAYLHVDRSVAARVALINDAAREQCVQREHIVVTGRLVIRNWTKAERSGIDVEIIADTLGHDLTWYTTAAVRGIPARAGHDQSEMERGESPESAEAESVESAEAAAAYESSDRTADHSGDGFVPVETDAEQDVFARLDS